MIFYTLVIFSIFLSAILAFSLYRNLRLKFESKFLDDSLRIFKDQNQILEESRIENIQKIEQLTEKLKYKEQTISDFEKLKEESKVSTKAVLFDLGNELSKQLIEIHKKENKESRENSEKNIQETATKFNSEFERIVKMVGSLSKEVSQSKDIVDVIKNSLLSPSGAGALAEITLENIMKSSGLRMNVDYNMQYSVNGENNEILRPDSVVFLPGDKIMIVDAKASKFLVDDQDDPKTLAKTMNNHLRSLSGKSYAEAVRNSLKTKDNNIGNIVTIMFLPTEHAVEKLLDADGEFMNKAWKHNIFPVGPSGLMNMLSFAKFQISEQMMVQNHQRIIEEVQKLIASVGSMAEHSNKLGGSISSVANHYDKFAASFNKNFLSKARNISKMGIEGGLKKGQESLKRFQVISSQSELIEIEAEEELKEIEEMKVD
jgi:DNA recombination protein RmuC